MQGKTLDYRVIPEKSLAHGAIQLYKNQEHQLITLEDFFLPFGGTLNKDNRWVRLTQIIPWWKVKKHYAVIQKSHGERNPAVFSPPSPWYADHPATPGNYGSGNGPADHGKPVRVVLPWPSSFSGTTTFSSFDDGPFP